MSAREPVIRAWPADVDRWAREREEAERENGPECMGCATECANCPEREDAEPPAVSDGFAPALPDPCPIDCSRFKSGGIVEAGDEPF